MHLVFLLSMPAVSLFATLISCIHTWAWSVRPVQSS